MADIEAFKQQTFSLIKQQATKIKSSCKELEIKDEQIKFLKQTIESLEEERNEGEKVIKSLKNKIEIIMKEVAQYNENVVHKIYNDNEVLTKNYHSLVNDYEKSCEDISRMTRMMENVEEKNQSLTLELEQIRKEISTDTADKTKLIKQNQNLKATVDENQRQIFKLESIVEQLKSKNITNEKQIDTLIGKCQETANICEKKIKGMKETFVKKQEVTRAERQLSDCRLKNEELKRFIDQQTRERNEMSLENKMLKEKQISQTMKMQIEKSTISTDIHCLKQSFKINKKMGEFQSDYAEDFYEIFEAHYSLLCSESQSKSKIQYFQERISEIELKLLQKESQLEQCQSELQILREKIKGEVEAVESSYEGKILQLSIKIKKEEKAIHQLNLKDKEFLILSEEYEKLVQDHECLKQTFENTENQYKKQNEKLLREIEELLGLCDENINTKNSLNCLKHTVNNLLAIIYFLHLNLLRAREARRKLFMPFISFYFKVSSTIADGRAQKFKQKKGLKPFKKCVLAVIAIQRMKNSSLSMNSGLLRYADKALQKKLKIEEVSLYLDKLLQKSIDFEKDSLKLLDETKLVYKWSCVHNYNRINLPVGYYEQILLKRVQ